MLRHVASLSGLSPTLLVGGWLVGSELLPRRTPRRKINARLPRCPASGFSQRASVKQEHRFS